MVKELVFASANVHKTAEVSAMLAGYYKVLNLADIGCFTDIPETGSTFNENAFLKSSYVVKNYGFDCFADDSGLEVTALNKAPGVYSARYSGTRDDLLNLTLLLKNIGGKSVRSACFKTVIALILNNKVHYFEGEINGSITLARRGSNGFGYDPVFIPDGYTTTFAQMSNEEKNQISHRAIAVKKMVAFLLATAHP